ncbi:MAG: hydroxymethylglutaryl-CoA lyase [Myxococcales bacterium]|nr:hydroxymethylglutaryl-CoA lyase [Myxococcales bacterium]
MNSMPQLVEIVEVGPRDGLQNERVRIATATKVHFVKALAEAGLRRIEVSSFVHPKAIPQLADAEQVFAGLTELGQCRLSALVPNEKGLERALVAHVSEIAVFTAATDTFVRHNIHESLSESLVHFGPIVTRAIGLGIRVRGYVSTVFGCPYEGKVSPQQGIAVVRSLLDMGCAEVSIGDTIGVATPGDVARWLDRARAAGLPFERLALHFHDTRGTALANVLIGLQQGITVFDSSAGGLGGCPYAPGASGNLATEDLVYALHGMGYDTGVDLDKLVEASNVIANKIDHLLPSRYFQAARVTPCLPA